MEKKRLLILLLVLGLSFSTYVFAEEKITEEEVRDFFKNLETIVMDIDAYSQTLADDYKFVTFVGNNKSELSREECIKELEIQMKSVREYDYKFKISNLNITGNKAIVKGRVIERVALLSGETAYEENDVEVTLEKVDGKIKQKLTKSTISKEKLKDFVNDLFGESVTYKNER